jgi:DNA ligase-associated metallophosphoesterase
MNKTFPQPAPARRAVQVAGHEAELRSDGTIWLAEHQTLLLADLHLGKDASFRAAGIPVPARISEATLDLLSVAVKDTSPRQIVILGDLIHDRKSLSPPVVQLFADWRRQHADLAIHLVRGNHDRHVRNFPDNWHLTISALRQLGPFLLCHKTFPDGDHPGPSVRVGGHWHPVVHVGGSADRLRLRCFVVDPFQITLPAFGPFKGGLPQTRGRRRRIFAIHETGLVLIPSPGGPAAGKADGDSQA